MKHRPWFVGTASALALGIIATTSEATPVNGTAIKIKAIGRDDSIIEKVAYRHCGRRSGRRHCRLVTYRSSNSGYYERDSNALPYGTSIWWDQMMRENRAGNPGGGGSGR
jgi:hypothetical protein